MRIEPCQVMGERGGGKQDVRAGEAHVRRRISSGSRQCKRESEKINGGGNKANGRREM